MRSSRGGVLLRISTHALREEGDQPGQLGKQRQSHFYPRPPRGGRLAKFAHSVIHAMISTHALREEGDRGQATNNQVAAKNFYPRPPRGGRPRLKIPGRTAFADFYPRPPRGGRLCRPARPGIRPIFLPTPSARRATGVTAEDRSDGPFLPTPSARRATRCSLVADVIGIPFLPTPSARRATRSATTSMAASSLFLPTPSARRATANVP